MHDILLGDKHDFYTLMRLQTTNVYNLKTTILSVDMTEYYLSNPNNFEHIKALLQETVVVICKIPKFEELMKSQSKKELKYDFIKDDKVV